ncbi:MAG: flavin reductase family protein [Halobacteriota archaeon]|jgi:flavin reductase (DIM6/NTAB) family NADH-FMN oxidoreductase RutF
MNVVQTVLWKLINPIAIVTARCADNTSGFVASWITQVSFVPPLIMVAVNPLHYTYELIVKSNAFAVNILRTDQAELVDVFGKSSGRKVVKFASAAYDLGSTGSPILKDCLAFVDCTVMWTREAGDHVLVVGSVANAAITSDGETLQEARSMYTQRASIGTRHRGINNGGA